jgi:hypothetical protein
MRLGSVRFRLGFRAHSRGDDTIIRIGTFLVGPALALLVVAGCGGGGSKSSSAASDPAIRDQAATAIEKAAAGVVNQTPDKYLPGPKSYKVVCLEPGVNAGAKEVADNQVRCHVESFFDPYKGKAGGYLWSEDWVVTAQNGKVSNPVIFGEYRIKNFLIEDNKKNCTGRHQPHECLPADAYAPPPDQSGGAIGGGATGGPATGGP